MKTFIFTFLLTLSQLLHSSEKIFISELPFPDHQEVAASQLRSISSEMLDQDWCLNQFFGTVIVINMEGKLDRLAFVTENLKKIGTHHFEIFKAVNGRKEVCKTIWKKFGCNWARIDLTTEEGKKQFDGQRQGEAGCYISHYRVIKQMKDRFEIALKDMERANEINDPDLKEKAQSALMESRSVLILEDDNGFGIVFPDTQSVSMTSTGQLFREAMKEMPKDWDMFYFMTYPKPMVRNKSFSLHLAKLLGGRTTNAYAINYTMYEKLEKELSKIFLDDITVVQPIDNELAVIHASYNCFAILPSIAYQNSGETIINEKNNSFLLQLQPL